MKRTGKQIQIAAALVMILSSTSVWALTSTELSSLKAKAAQGNATAEYNLGAAYVKGHGVTKSYAKAVYWFRKAAAQGDAVAEAALGNNYSLVAQDSAKANYWFRKAAAQGNIDAEFMLGVAYFYGRGVTQSYTKAIYWYRKAGYEDGLRMALSAQRAAKAASHKADQGPK